MFQIILKDFWPILMTRFLLEKFHAIIDLSSLRFFMFCFRQAINFFFTYLVYIYAHEHPDRNSINTQVYTHYIHGRNLLGHTRKNRFLFKTPWMVFPNFAIICIEPSFCALPVARDTKTCKRSLKNHYHMSKLQRHFHFNPFYFRFSISLLICENEKTMKFSKADV